MHTLKKRSLENLLQFSVADGDYSLVGIGRKLFSIRTIIIYPTTVESDTGVFEILHIASWSTTIINANLYRNNRVSVWIRNLDACPHWYVATSHLKEIICNGTYISVCTTCSHGVGLNRYLLTLCSSIATNAFYGRVVWSLCMKSVTRV